MNNSTSQIPGFDQVRKDLIELFDSATEFDAFLADPSPTTQQALLDRLHSAHHDEPGTAKERAHNRKLDTISGFFTSDDIVGALKELNTLTEMTAELRRRNILTLIVVATGVPRALAFGWSIKKLWNWFMPAPVLPITTAQALGLGRLIGVFLPQPELNQTWQELKKKEYTPEQVYQPAVNQIAFFLGSVCVGWLLKRFMRED